MPEAWIMGILCTFLHLKYVQEENPHRAFMAVQYSIAII